MPCISVFSELPLLIYTRTRERYPTGYSFNSVRNMKAFIKKREGFCVWIESNLNALTIITVSSRTYRHHVCWTLFSSLFLEAANVCHDSHYFKGTGRFNAHLVWIWSQDQGLPCFSLLWTCSFLRSWNGLTSMDPQIRKFILLRNLRLTINLLESPFPIAYHVCRTKFILQM